MQDSARRSAAARERGSVQGSNVSATRRSRRRRSAEENGANRRFEMRAIGRACDGLRSPHSAIWYPPCHDSQRWQLLRQPYARVRCTNSRAATYPLTPTTTQEHEHRNKTVSRSFGVPQHQPATRLR